MMNTTEVNKVNRSYSNKDLEIFDVNHKEKLINRMITSNYFDEIHNTVLRTPTKLGFYSLKIDKISKKREYYADKSELKYLNLTSNLSYDLNSGYNSLIKWGEDQCGLDEFLLWILENRNKFTVNQQLPSILNLNTDFVCYRGVLTKILVTPYEKREDWMLIAIKIGNTIYFHQLKTDARLAQDAAADENLNKMSYAGHRFEDMVCRGPDQLADDGGRSLGSGHSGQFCCILRSRINRHSLIYAAEMDCVEKKSQLTDPLSALSFIEVKTTTTIKHNKQYENFYRYKAIKWWAQSYLGNINKIICGYRDPDLFVRKIDSMTTGQLAKKSNTWSPRVCLNFLDNFLNATKDAVTKEMVCYRIYCSPTIITFFQTELPVESFIPRWYIEEHPPTQLI